MFLGQWERALAEGKEVVVTGDMNINFIDWHRYDLPHNNPTSKLKHLISELFGRIFSQGVSQLVTVATRTWPGREDSGLDHVYTNNPMKISQIQVNFCGSSDHKLIFFIRYAKNIKEKARYITKRCYKNFCPGTFINAVRQVNWWSLYQCEDVETAQRMLSDNRTIILD